MKCEICGKEILRDSQCINYKYYHNDCIENLKNQQKEFIKYLEDLIKQQETVIAENQEKLYFLIYEDKKEDLKLSSQKAYIRRIILEEILKKYKETIGDKE